MLPRRAAALLLRGAASSARRPQSSRAEPLAAQRRWPLAAAAAAAAAAALACSPSSPAFALHGAPSVDPDAAFASLDDGAPPSPQQLAALHAWLAAHGADVAGVAVAPCASDPAAGLGVVSTRPAPAAAWLPRPLRPGFWLRSPGRTLAEFPLGAALSARSICAEPRCGALYARWVAEGALSDREALMLFLFVERARGDTSHWAPYIACLPARPPGPVCWRSEELAALRGTPAAEAVAAQRRALRAALPRLAPLAAEALAAAGVRNTQLTLSDLAWASGVFWSRALALPDLEALRQRAPGQPVPPLQEAIVPGLDFCNHAAAAPATWTLLGPRAALSSAAPAPDALPTTVALQERGCGSPALRQGQEVRISYGNDRSSEEMLFGYGFAPDDDVADALMLAPPLPPPSDFDAPNAARLALLQAAGRAPRAFLPLRALRDRGGREARAAMEGAYRCAGQYCSV